MKIIEIRKIFPDQRVARYNLSAWYKPQSNSINFIGREVKRAGSYGQPDTGVLKLFEVNESGEVVHDRVIWQPTFDGINLEDPRALEIDDKTILIGLTAVLRNKNGQPLPFPAIIKLDSHTIWQEELPPFLIVSTFGPGKNLTPIDSYTFLFRPDKTSYHHKILVFSLHRQIPEKLDDIDFPKNLKWATWRIGTTIPPIWLNDTEALFIIHGISIQNIGNIKKYVYSIGRAKLTRINNSYSVQVAKDPILTPDNFINANGEPLVKELHPKLRRVVYSCGGIIKRNHQDTLALYVNVGDRTTYEVQFSISELKDGLF